MQESWDRFLAEGFSQGYSWLVYVIIGSLFIVYWLILRKIHGQSKSARDTKQRIYDRWHDQGRDEKVDK